MAGGSELKITVVGMGYVGIVAAAGLAAGGHEVLGVDIDRVRIEALDKGRVPLYEPGLEARVAEGLARGLLCFRHRDDVVEDLGEAALIATGTPPTHGGGADLNQVMAAVSWIKAVGRPGLVVVMKSTVPPGTGRRIIEHELTGTGIRYVSNPEFLREGRAVRDWDAPDRIVIGAEGYATAELAERMHVGIEAPRMVTDVTSAEMIKYASNAFLATRISFINEIAALCASVGASIDAVSEGLAMDSRTGARIYAGVGYGGSCFPKDVRALDYLALTSGGNADLLRSVINTNNRQRVLPLHALRRRFDGALSGLRVGILGLSFKPETDDVRDAPSLDLIRALVDEGISIRAFDPHASESARPHLPPSVDLVPSVAEAANRAQALVLLTEWDQIVQSDWQIVARCMLPPRYVFDGRNALDPMEMDRLGFEYLGVGRSSVRSGLPEAGPLQPVGPGLAG